jgi:hypothetical protein
LTCGKNAPIVGVDDDAALTRARNTGTMAHQNPPPGELPPGHVPMPVLLTGTMGLVLAAGLHLTGQLGTLDRAIAGLVSADAADLPPALPQWSLWLATATLAYGMALVVLEIPGNWRRAVILTSTLAVLSGWLPVTYLAGRHAAIAAPLVAAAWSGICSLVYATRHHMHADDVFTSTHHPSDDSD